MKIQEIILSFKLIPTTVSSPETAVGVHGFSVSPSWQFQSDKTGVFLTPDRHFFETQSCVL
jgi:hypothetical protein